MYELPLFPLNTVLFPGMPLQLHVFEERYKKMMNLCIEKQRPFGVVLIRKGRAEYGPLAEPYVVGCTAHITQIQPLAEGRMNVVGIGQERFRIVSVQHDQDYLVGMVEPYPLQNTAAREIAPLSQALRAFLQRFLRLLNHSGQIRYPVRQLPKDPISLAYLAAILIHMPAPQQQVLLGDLITSEKPLSVKARFYTFVAQQQVLLETQDAVHLMRDLVAIYRRETALLEALSRSADDDDAHISLD